MQDPLDDVSQAETATEEALVDTKSLQTAQDAVVLTTPTKRNAFDELLAKRKINAATTPAANLTSPKRPRTSMSTDPAVRYGGRNALLWYIESPSSFPNVISYNADWVLLHDKYPKASLHLLLLPRSPAYHSEHPITALRDPAFLASARRKVEEVLPIAASELQRLHGKYSAQDQKRNAALDADDPPAILPSGRPWISELKVGIHANPSMNHVHIHVLSRDMHSPSLKLRAHYQSFNTDFLCEMEDMPLSKEEGEYRRRSAGEKLHGELECWRCGVRFGSRMKEFKGHLAKEFVEWRSE